MRDLSAADHACMIMTKSSKISHWDKDHQTYTPLSHAHPLTSVDWFFEERDSASNANT